MSNWKTVYLSKIKGLRSRRVWAVLRNSDINVNRKTVHMVLRKNSFSSPSSKHRGVLKYRNLMNQCIQGQFWQTAITLIPKQKGMT